jgi:toxin ParE1/3/4
MSHAIQRRQMAGQDLVRIFRHYAREAGFRVANRFFAQAEATFDRLASMPGIGTSYEHDHSALAGLRDFPISGFRKYLVFYRSTDDGIEVVRILHGARDIHIVLAAEFAVDADGADDDDADESD